MKNMNPFVIKILVFIIAFAVVLMILTSFGSNHHKDKLVVNVIKVTEHVVVKCSETPKPEEEKPIVIEEPVAVVEEEPIVVVEEEIEYYDVPLSEDLQDYIIELCEDRNIDPTVIFAMIKQESTFNADAVGDGGNSLGLMQIQPRWHSERMEKLGCDDLLDPYQNVTVGIDILNDLLESGGSLEWALMAYNGGNAYADSNASQGILSAYAASVISNSEVYKA